jgi:ribosomal protein S27E
MIEIVFALILELNGTMIEHVYKDSLKACLYSKRIAKQEVNPERVVFKCKKVEAETEVYQGKKKNYKNNRKMKKQKFKVEAEIVNGKCPTCDQFTMLVGIEQSFFRCMNCGSDLEQHINGKITYLPVITAPADGAKPFVKEWLDDG